ncbi:hypothetical protein FIU96_20080 (plasmid) [Marinobacter sp. THAF39]|nr:hypothetical protein FIV08_07345 [Marinobacter sp. THAF197a]QFT50431.1 hypothetical protein FIU96_07275 [Marinobacter sp. THAF39]QFT52953.1 hypothetical protein FIU96_20080 [Marinobacter sp. THAF39]
MDVQQHFETMVKQYLPNADLRRDPDHPGFYLDQSTQTAWAGFKALHSDSVQNTTNDSGHNHEKVGVEDS